MAYEQQDLAYYFKWGELGAGKLHVAYRVNYTVSPHSYKILKRSTYVPGIKCLQDDIIMKLVDRSLECIQSIAQNIPHYV